MFGTPTAKPGSPLLNRAALFLFLALSSAAVFGQSGNRILVLSGTNTTCNWNLQRQATLTLTGNSVNTHINVPQNTTIKTAYILRVVSAGTFTLDFAFTGGGTTTNWASQMNNRPRNGVTYYTFEQYGTTVDITADPDVYPTAAGQVLTRITGATVYTNINLASSEAVGTTVLSILNGGSGQATANDALNAFLPSQVGQAGEFLTTDGANTSWAAAGGGSQVWVNDSGTIQPASGQTTNRLSFTSGAADNATNVAFQVDTATEWLEGDSRFISVTTGGTNDVFSLRPQIMRFRNGDSDVEFSVGGDDTFPASTLRMSAQATNDTTNLYLTANYGFEEIYMQRANWGVLFDWWPSVESGSATAYYYNTANVLTNSDKLVSIRNAGVEKFSVEHNGTAKIGSVTKAQKTAMTPADGMIVYQTDNTPGFRVYVNGGWLLLSTAADP